MRISAWSSDVFSSELFGEQIRVAGEDAIVARIENEPERLVLIPAEPTEQQHRQPQGSGDGDAGPETCAGVEHLGGAPAFVARSKRHAGTWGEIPANDGGWRSEERRVGQECVSTCSSRRSPHHHTNNTPPNPTPPHTS